MRRSRDTPLLLALWLGLCVSGCSHPPPPTEEPAVEVEDTPAVGADVVQAGAPSTDDMPEKAGPSAEAEPGAEVEAGPEHEPMEVVVLDPGAPQIEHPEALGRFFSALDRVRTEERGAIARILHMGDSSVGLDGLPQAIRTRMQERFGDAGPGFVLIDRFSKNYTSNVAKIEAGGWKICYIAYLCKKDGHYGLGGHTFRGVADAWTKIGPHRSSANGRTISKLELWYAATPSGGDLKLRVDKGPYELINTRADALEDRWHQVEVEAGEHRLELRGGSNGPVRVYGVAMENDGPGIVWDTVSMTGAYVRRLHGYDDEHIAGQVAHRDPDLLVVSYGGNDLRRFVSGSVKPDDFKEEYRTTVRKLRQGKEGLACLIVGVTDHARSGTYNVRSEHMELMTAIEREVANEEKCAFFDSVAAMGGPGSVHTWVKQGKVSPDEKHLSRRGVDIMGGMIYDALLAAYSASRAPRDGAA